MRAFQTASLIGKDYEGISDAHNMVVVVTKTYGKETPGGASEPTGPTLTGGARNAAQSLANMLEDQPRPPTRRKARNGYLYTKEEFLAHYGEDGTDQWDEADEPDEYKRGPPDVNSVLGRALWPRETPKMMMKGPDGEDLIGGRYLPTGGRHRTSLQDTAARAPG